MECSARSGAGTRARSPLAVNDSRSYVRALFLASAARLDVLPFLTQPRTLAELVERTGATRVDRLGAWLDIGVALHELHAVGDRYALRGRRAKAIAARDPVLTAHYRSMLDYQAGPYDELASLLRDGPDDGRDDLDRHATTIAEVSRAAAPFVLPFLQEITATVPAARLLDIGCGTGVYLQAMLEVAPEAVGVGIDLAPDVIADARAALAAAGFGARATFDAGDVRDHLATTTDRYDVVTLINNVYYFAPRRAARPLPADPVGAHPERRAGGGDDGDARITGRRAPQLDADHPGRARVAAARRRGRARPARRRLHHRRDDSPRARRAVRRHPRPPVVGAAFSRPTTARGRAGGPGRCRRRAGGCRRR